MESPSNRAAGPQGGHGAGRPLDPLFNEAFVRVFGRRESRAITRSLVNAVLREAGVTEIGEITEIDGEHTELGGSVECKAPRLDVRIVAPGRMVDLESERHEGALDDRLMLYASRLLADSAARGLASYSDLPQVVVVTLYDARVVFPGDDAIVSCCRMRWDVGGRVADGTDRVLFVLVELRKFRKRYNRLSGEVLGDELLSWLYLLTSGYGDEDERRAIMSSFPTMEEFAELYGYAVGDPKLKRAYEDYESSILEEDRRQRYYAELEREAREGGMRRGFEQGMERGMAEGLEKGIEQGIEQGRFQAFAGLVGDGLLGATEAAARLGVTEAEFERRCGPPTA